MGVAKSRAASKQDETEAKRGRVDVFRDRLMASILVERHSDPTPLESCAAWT